MFLFTFSVVFVVDLKLRKGSGVLFANKFFMCCDKFLLFAKSGCEFEFVVLFKNANSKIIAN